MYKIIVVWFVVVGMCKAMEREVFRFWMWCCGQVKLEDVKCAVCYCEKEGFFLCMMERGEVPTLGWSNVSVQEGRGDQVLGVY